MVGCAAAGASLMHCVGMEPGGGVPRSWRVHLQGGQDGLRARSLAKGARGVSGAIISARVPPAHLPPGAAAPTPR